MKCSRYEPKETLSVKSSIRLTQQKINQTSGSKLTQKEIESIIEAYFDVLKETLLNGMNVRTPLALFKLHYSAPKKPLSSSVPAPKEKYRVKATMNTPLTKKLRQADTIASLKSIIDQKEEDQHER